MLNSTELKRINRQAKNLALLEPLYQLIYKIQSKTSETQALVGVCAKTLINYLLSSIAVEMDRAGGVSNIGMLKICDEYLQVFTNKSAVERDYIAQVVVRHLCNADKKYHPFKVSYFDTLTRETCDLTFHYLRTKSLNHASDETLFELSDVGFAILYNANVMDDGTNSTEIEQFRLSLFVAREDYEETKSTINRLYKRTIELNNQLAEIGLSIRANRFKTRFTDHILPFLDKCVTEYQEYKGKILATEDKIKERLEHETESAKIQILEEILKDSKALSHRYQQIDLQAGQLIKQYKEIQLEKITVAKGRLCFDLTTDFIDPLLRLQDLRAVPLDSLYALVANQVDWQNLYTPDLGSSLEHIYTNILEQEKPPQSSEDGENIKDLEDSNETKETDEKYVSRWLYEQLKNHSSGYRISQLIALAQDDKFTEDQLDILVMKAVLLFNTESHWEALDQSLGVQELLIPGYKKFTYSELLIKNTSRKIL